MVEEDALKHIEVVRLTQKILKPFESFSPLRMQSGEKIFDCIAEFLEADAKKMIGAVALLFKSSPVKLVRVLKPL
jgi:hypothetical protein